ncbi:MAG: FAD-binding oxidoreductase [Gemmatimonadetes bacterium]|nr:FAD-binding oxidoreductase [Gemmatimonadota bacterium]
MGVATAWELARRGEAVVVYEATGVADGASGGFGYRGVRANGRDLRELPLMARAYEIWPELADALGSRTGYDRIGHLRLYEAPHEEPSSAHRARVQASMGIPSQHLGRAQLLEMEPGLGPTVRGAVHCPMDGVADHGATTQAYAGAAQGAGAEVRVGRAVTGLISHGGRVKELELEGGDRVPVSGELLLLANSATPTLVEGAFGRELPVWAVLPQVLWTSAEDETPPFTSLLGHAHRRISLKLIPDGRIMISGGWRGTWDRSGAPTSIPDHVKANWDEAVRVLPSVVRRTLEGAQVDRPESVSVDGIPVIDRLPEASNVIVATGWSGHGWAIAPAVAELLAAWVTSGNRPGLLGPFCLGRFA